MLESFLTALSLSQKGVSLRIDHTNVIWFIIDKFAK